MKITWKTEKRKIEELKPFPGNPRRADEKEWEQLSKSIEKFDLADPLVINTDGTVIGGNFRLKILKEKGVKEVDVRVPSRKLTRKEAEELNLRLNKNQGEWDEELLANFDEDMLKDIGWSEEELDEIFGLETIEDFDVEKEIKRVLKEKERRVKPGDIWKLGEHLLIVGDCTKRENWERLMGDEKFDFLFTDPPYKLAYSKKRKKRVKTKEGMKLKRARTYLEVGETDKDGKPKGFGYKQNRVYLGVEEKGGVPEYDEWLSIAKDFQNPEGASVMIFENWRNTVELWQAIEKYWKLRNMVIWHLPNRHQGFGAKHKFFSKYDIAPLATHGKVELNEEYEKELEDYLKEKGQIILDTYEVILYGTQGDAYWDRKKGTRWAKVSDHITSVAESEYSSGQNVVFGTKPLSILVPYIKILSPRYGIVVDCFAGSGSTILACEIMKRKCRAIEISDIYSEVILARWEKFTGKQAEKINEIKTNDQK